MPVYNAEPFVAAAMQSVLAQTMRDLELIVVDDGSTDGSLTAALAVAAADQRVKVLQQTNAGVSVAMNTAIAAASTPLIARLDADDIALPQRLTVQMDYLDSHPTIAAVGSAARVISESGDTDQYIRHPTSPAEVRMAMERDSAIVNSSAMMRTDAVRTIGGCRRAFEASEDYDLWLRLLDSHELANLPDVLVHYRIHRGQISTRRRFQIVLGRLAARYSAKLRRERRQDPLEHATAITVQSLQQWGMAHSAIERELFAATQPVFDSLLTKGETAAAGQLSEELGSTVVKPSRWLRSQLANQAAAVSRARGDQRGRRVALARAWLLDPPFIGRALRFIGRRL
jgi:GT2 family glycosyltransferase